LRINRFLALAGLGARRKCEALITQGRIEVNGTVIGSLAVQVDPEADRITLDGERIRVPRQSTYLLLNKPSGVIVSASDERGRVTVYDLLPARFRGRVRAVGRLDRASEGLLLFTNDGSLAHNLMHPSRGIEKTYLAWVSPTPKPEALKALRSGVALGRGERSGPAKVQLVSGRKEKARLRITITEGKNREIRRMLRSVGCRVLMLRRIRIDGVRLGELRSGSCRPLTAAEVAALRGAGSGAGRRASG
jgi:pseudouridine synthase